MSILMIHAAIAVWWSFAAFVFAVLYSDGDVSPRECLAVAVFWPVLAPFGLLVVLWRIPFRTAKAIRADMRNRGQAKEFQEWLAARKKLEGQGE